MFNPADEVWEYLTDLSNVAWSRRPSRLTGLESPTTLPGLAVIPTDYDPQATTLEIAAEGVFAYDVMLFIAAEDTRGVRYHTEPNNNDSFVSRCIQLQNDHLQCGRVRLTEGFEIETAEFTAAGGVKRVWVISTKLIVISNRSLGVISTPTITPTLEEALTMPEGAQEELRIGRVSWSVTASPVVSDSELERLRSSVEIVASVPGVSVNRDGNVFYSGAGFDFEAQQAEAITFTFNLDAVAGMTVSASAELDSSITITDVLDTPQPTAGAFTELPTIEQNHEFTSGVLGAVVATASSTGGPVGARTYSLVSGRTGYTINAVTGAISYSGSALPTGTEIELEVAASWEALGLAQAATITTTITWTITQAPAVQLPSTIVITRAASYQLNERLEGPVDVGAFSAEFQTEGAPGVLTYTVTAADEHTEDDDWVWNSGQIEYLGGGIDYDDVQSVQVSVMVSGAETLTALAPDSVTETLEVAVVLIPRATVITASAAQTLSIQEHTTGAVGSVEGSALCNTDEAVDVVFAPIGAGWSEGSFGLDDSTGEITAAEEFDYAAVQQVVLNARLSTVATSRCAAAAPVDVVVTIQILDDPADNQPQVPVAESVVFNHPASSIIFSWSAPTRWGDELGDDTDRRFEVQYRADSVAEWADAPDVSFGGQLVFTLADVVAGDFYRFRVRAVNADGVASGWVERESEIIRYQPSIAVTGTSATVTLAENTPGPVVVATGLPTGSIVPNALIPEFNELHTTVNFGNLFEYSLDGTLTYIGDGYDYETDPREVTLVVIYALSANEYHIVTVSPFIIITVNITNDLSDNVPDAPTGLSHSPFASLGVSGFSWTPPADWRDTRGTGSRSFMRSINGGAEVEIDGGANTINIIWGSGNGLLTGSSNTFGLRAINRYGVTSPTSELAFDLIHDPTLTPAEDFTGYTLELAENDDGSATDPTVLQDISGGAPTLDARSVTIGLTATASLTGTGADRFRISGDNLEYVGGGEDMDVTSSYSLMVVYDVAAGSLNTAASYSYPVSVTITAPAVVRPDSPLFGDAGDIDTPFVIIRPSSFVLLRYRLPTNWADGDAGIGERLIRLEANGRQILLDSGNSYSFIYDSVSTSANPLQIESGVEYVYTLTAINSLGVESLPTTMSYTITHLPFLSESIPNFSGYIVTLEENMQGTPDAPLVLRELTQGLPTRDARSVELGLAVEASITGTGSSRFRIVGMNLEYIGGAEDFETTESYSLTASFVIPSSNINEASNVVSWPIQVNIVDVADTAPPPPAYGTFLAEVAVPETEGTNSVGALLMAPRDAALNELEFLSIPAVPSSSLPARLYDLSLVRDTGADTWTMSMGQARRSYSVIYATGPRPRGAATIDGTLGTPTGDGRLGNGGGFYIADFRLDNVVDVNILEAGSNLINADGGNVFTTSLDNVRQVYVADTGDDAVIWAVSNHTTTAQAYNADGDRLAALDITIAGAELDGVAGDYGVSAGSKLFIYDRVSNQVSRWTVNSASSVTRDVGATFALTAPHPNEVRHIVYVSGVLFTCQQSRTATNHLAAYWVG